MTTCDDDRPWRDFESSDLYKAVVDFVKQYMLRYDMSHDFNHIQRVLALAKYISAQEIHANPGRKIEVRAVVLAALLHDVPDRKYVDESEDPVRIIHGLMQQNGCPPDMLDKVMSIVQHISYSTEIKQPQLILETIATHPELAIVQDADRLDAIGAIGIARTFAYGAAKASDRGLQGSIDHFTEKLYNIEALMKTATGKMLAAKRTQRLKDFRQWWAEEIDIIA